MLIQLSSRYSDRLITGQKKTGKSFAMALCYYLNQPIMEGIIQHKREKIT